MGKIKDFTNSLSFKFALVGAGFGLLFPLLATLLEVNHSGMRLTWLTIASLHQHPSMRIIDSAPLFLGAFAYLAGNRQQRLEEQKERLENLIDLRSRDIIRQKLFYEALVDNSPIAIVTLDQDHRIISINPAFQKLFGYHQEEISGMDLDELIRNPDSPREAYQITERVLKGDAIHEFGKRRRKDGVLVDVEIFGEQINVNGKRIGVLGLYRDITSEKKAQEELRTSEERFRRIFSDSPVALRMEDYSQIKTWLDEHIFDLGLNPSSYFQEHPADFEKMISLANIIDLNDASLFMFGARDKQELQQHLRSILSCESISDAVEILVAMQDGATSLEKELIYQRLDGKKIYSITKLTIVPGFEKTWGRLLFSNLDITERKLAEERLSYLSLHDIMTGIYNRAFFEEEMARLTKSRAHPISILVMDMDNLKAINDRHGHQSGDSALQIVADIVKDCFRAEDIVARIGGDEIAVLLQGVDAAGAQKASERIQTGIRSYNQDGGAEMPLSLSIGCATAQPGQSLAEIFNMADTRMYQEKQAKKG